jgi:hypothetical protein
MEPRNRDPSCSSSSLASTEEEVPVLSFFFFRLKSSSYSIVVILELLGFLRLGGAILFDRNARNLLNQNGFIFVSL